MQFVDVLVDVEAGQVIYLESARYGDTAFTQFRQACLGQCPCLTEPPSRSGRPEEVAALRRLAPGTFGYLDADWDGRIFSAAGGHRYTVSLLKSATPREEYPMQLAEAEFVHGTWWLRVGLFRTNPCVAPDAVVVHACWVPAFSRSGHLVAASWPGGC